MSIMLHASCQRPLGIAHKSNTNSEKTLAGERAQIRKFSQILSKILAPVVLVKTAKVWFEGTHNHEFIAVMETTEK